jgi:hypothetical protein
MTANFGNYVVFHQWGDHISRFPLYHEEVTRIFQTFISLIVTYVPTVLGDLHHYKV